jgi:hypothetical protein
VDEDDSGTQLQHEKPMEKWRMVEKTMLTEQMHSLAGGLANAAHASKAADELTKVSVPLPSLGKAFSRVLADLHVTTSRKESCQSKERWVC